MSNKIKDIVVTISFLIIIVLMFVLNIIKKDTLVSLSERRKLQQFPKFSIENLFRGKFFEEFEKYTMDQFTKRETFRSLKANIEVGILRKKDSNHIYQYHEQFIEQIYPLNEKSVENIASKMNEIYKRDLLQSNKVYYTIVPDKNYFVNEDNLRLDYTKLREIMNQKLKDIEYIDIFDCLDLSCYYATDSHWKQEKLQKVVNKIANHMHLEIHQEYEEKKVTDFKGVYAGQFPIKMEYDEIRILTKEIIENCSVYNYETKEITPIYNMEKVNAQDKYDVYLSGATPLLIIENPMNHSNRELIVLRDSYGSSLVPLLVEGYSKITVIDTRYISPKILHQYIDFRNKDILFVYSTLLINNSTSLK